jgi:beta-phosphoglucomutase-like phosphatase (HAD superfamily)
MERREGGAARRLSGVSLGYQNRDAAVVDYQLWQAWPDGDWLRGPAPSSLAPGSYFAAVGAAQTFGCFVGEPVAEPAGAAARPAGIEPRHRRSWTAWFRREPVRALLANARFVVFQVLSGRSADNSRFAGGGRERVRRTDGRELGADAAWREELQRDLVGIENPVLRGVRNRVAAWFGRSTVRQLVHETRADWQRQFAALLDETAPPKLLLWWSRRRPDYRARYHSLASLFGEFPQLVDRAMVERLRPLANGYVECVTQRGSPQPLVDRHTGAPTSVQPAAAGTGEDPALRWHHNAYYPSPAMHEDAAAALLAPARALLARG